MYKRQVNRVIDKKKYKYNTFINFFEQKTFLTEQKLREEINLPSKMIIKKHGISKFYRFFPPLVFLIIALWGVRLIFVKNIINNTSITITSIFCLLFLGNLIYDLYAKKSFVELNNFYLKTNESLIFWNQIIDINLSIIHKDKSTIYKCIVGLNSGITEIIDLTEFSFPYEITKEIIVNKTLYNTGYK